MAKVAIGGTFECLHDGHRELLSRAFELAEGGQVDIGLTSNEMASRRNRAIPDYSSRKSQLLEYLQGISGNTQYRIIELNDPYGRTLDEDYDHIVVSPETYPVALRINSVRVGKGMRPIEIVKIGFVLAEDSERISSTRIVRGEIDIHGHIIH
ncbi:MAG: pantetheine-phosphate adenylyltransferase [Methanolobus sp.]|nr:pantetheine-phosphate adenylyltransferase [Methanolobus sp.]MDK2833235.1 pantetheine-phosphate adenylyltransferase [Methanolobus sp.]MDK2911091.1 pantetheine-phosphate adenylyltransferase [Methanolobus sp.]MDN5309038.1 pantetheine-phosphate adenylyltransferase [Methanolobus sp.]